MAERQKILDQTKNSYHDEDLPVPSCNVKLPTALEELEKSEQTPDKDYMLSQFK
jgi:hypothetical protein